MANTGISDFAAYFVCGAITATYVSHDFPRRENAAYGRYFCHATSGAEVRGQKSQLATAKIRLPIFRTVHSTCEVGSGGPAGPIAQTALQASGGLLYHLAAVPAQGTVTYNLHYQR